MNSQILAVAIDCHDAESLAAFWCEALGYQITNRWTDAKGLEYREIRGTTGEPMVLFQPVGGDTRLEDATAC